MEIVIKISDEDYEYLKTHNKHGLYSSILNGTPLPKGHGRLVDEKIAYKKFYARCLAKVATEVFAEIPTIIETDRAESGVCK